MAEMWDLVDKDGNYVGIKWPRDRHDEIPEGLYHPCVEVWVKVGDKILISRRHPDKSEGLKYDAPGGAVVSGEDISVAAVRELEEEIGISASAEQLEYLGVILSRVGYAVSYLLRLERLPEIRLQPTEVVGYRLLSCAELDEMIDQLCETCGRRYLVYRDKLFN